MDDRQNHSADELRQLRERIKQLERENRKTNRELVMLHNFIEKNKVFSRAQANLGAVITAEKSKQEKYMQLLLQNCPDVILLFDQFDRLAYCTDTFLDRAEVSNFGLVDGMDVLELFERFADPDWSSIIAGAIQKAKRERQTVVIEELVAMAEHGPNHSYTCQITPMLGENGMAEGCMALFHDLTELLRAKAQLEQASSAKSDFLATVSHEIRTPMNAIIGISDIMKKTELTPQQQDHLNNIQNSSFVLLNLINDILDFSKIEAGRLELVNDYFSLAGLLRHIESMFRVMFQQKGLSFLCELEENLPDVVFGDEKRLGQVLTNLLNNALKYTNAGCVRFHVYADAGDTVCFDISDTGIGIREEDLERIYSAFEQLDKVKNKKVVGTGLGLAITKRLCELMNGSIVTTSVYGEGSTFLVRVDLPRGTEADLPAVVTEELRFTAPGARVLLVDDIEINLFVAAAMLEAYDIVPDQATGGAQAIEMVRRNDYDIIFMDHMMPEMDGVEATRAIRALGGAAERIPIIALTANAVTGAMEMFLSNGFNGFISKPIDSAVLSGCLYEWLPDELIRREEE